MRLKPNALTYMIEWGFLSGFVLTFLYFIFSAIPAAINFSDYVLGSPIIIFTFVAIFFMSSVFGGILGGALGFVYGNFLSYLTRKIEKPRIETNINLYRLIAYPSIFTLTALLSVLFFADSSLTFRLLFTIISAMTASYGTHRYLLNLYQWSKPSHKTKNSTKDVRHAIERLSDDYYAEALLSQHNEKRRRIEKR